MSKATYPSAFYREAALFFSESDRDTTDPTASTEEEYEDQMARIISEQQTRYQDNADQWRERLKKSI